MIGCIENRSGQRGEALRCNPHAAKGFVKMDVEAGTDKNELRIELEGDRSQDFFK